MLRLSGTDRFTETVPMLDENGTMTATDVDRELIVDIAARWGTGYDTVVKSFVNIIATPKGGTHVQGFERGLTRAVSKAMEGRRGLLKAGEEVTKDDALEGLTAVVTVRLAEPQFEGQTKEVLGTPAVSRLAARIVESELTAFFNATKASLKAQARTVLEKVVSASRTRVQARAHKEAQRRKNALESSSLPSKLKDCRSTDVDRCELFIVEGQSALGTAMKANDHRQDYVRATVALDPAGLLVATPFATQDSSMLRTLVEANCLIVRPAGAPAAAAGDPGKVFMLR